LCLTLPLLAGSVFSSTHHEGVYVVSGSRIVRPNGSDIVVEQADFLTGIYAYHSNKHHTSRDEQDVVFLVTDTKRRGSAPLYKIVDGSVELVYDDKKTTNFADVVYSAATDTIYLTSSFKREIISVGPEGSRTYPVDAKPAGITIDPCTSTIYWSSAVSHSGEIFVWREGEGTVNHSRVLHKEGLSKPRALYFDVEGGHLYWTNQRRDTFTIMRSNPDGSNAVALVHDRGEPFSLTVTPTWIYWSDWAKYSTWRAKKDNSTRPELVNQFRPSRPNGMVYLPDEMPCTASSPAKVIAAKAKATTTTVAGDTSVSTKTDNSDSTTASGLATTNTAAEPVTAAATDGTLTTSVSAGNSTKTIFCVGGKVGYSGYCDCDEGWIGEYCQTDVCHNYCLYGVCRSLEDLPVCLCDQGYEGDRCERQITSTAVVDVVTPLLAVETLNTLVLLCFPILLGVQLVIIIVLSICVHKNRKRPRIVRKRFISASKYADKVSAKGKNIYCGDGKLPTEDGVQLDIEDCCNMAMCDTPCFDPPNVKSKDQQTPRKKLSRSDKLDKRSLLSDNDNEDYDY